MGWASGSEIAEKVFKVIKPYVSKKDISKIACEMYRIFTWYDADDWYIEKENIAYYYAKEKEPRIFKRWQKESEET